MSTLSTRVVLQALEETLARLKADKLDRAVTVHGWHVKVYPPRREHSSTSGGSHFIAVDQKDGERIKTMKRNTTKDDKARKDADEDDMSDVDEAAGGTFGKPSLPLTFFLDGCLSLELKLPRHGG